MDATDQARRLFMQALDHHNHNRLDQAEPLYRQALALLPDRLSLLVNLTALLIASERFEEALALAERAVVVAPEDPEARNQLALCRGQQDADPQRKLAGLERQLALQPDDPIAHNNHGLVLRQLGRLQLALQAFDRSLSLRPDEVGVVLNRADVLAAMGRHGEALAGFMQALRMAPGLAAAGQRFIHLVLDTGHLPAGPAEEFDALLVQAVSTPWARPQTIVPALVARMRSRGALAGVLASASSGASDLPGLEPEVVAREPLLPAWLQHALVTSLPLEQVLTGVRRALLQRAAESDGDYADPALLRLHAALAVQCHLNEFVWAVDEDEKALVRALAGKVRARLRAEAAIPASWLCALGSYQSLESIEGSEALAAKSWLAPMRLLIERQLREPMLERGLRAGIIAVTPISDDVSVKVRAQYERNPYPRWSSLPRDLRPLPLPRFLAAQLPGAGLPVLDASAKVHALNAGCGTGQHPIDMASRIAGIQILAVDLSLASLAYGKRQAQAMGLDNIEFVQGDIVELGRLDRRFGLIESTGVLHHMADPERGLSVLRGLLADNGVMRIALYSERARRGIVAARAHVAERGHEATSEGIRACRAELKCLPDKDPRKPATVFNDFHSMSECRDLLFHVQEHRFTLPGIAGLLDRQRLRLLGMEVPGPVAAAFERRFPSPQAKVDLAAWDAFETEHPDTFAAMYVFWVTPRT